MSSFQSPHRAKRKRKKQYDKVPVKDRGIDSQILALHEAMAEKCLADTSLLAPISERIEMRYAAKQMKYGAYLTWLSIIELIDKPEQFKEALLEKSVKMRSLRRATVFTQILSEEERVVIINNHNEKGLNEEP
ncbi:hypothetical protein [Glaciecola sp. MF2-115]|uniref:hypothetical protein n=1 Tax=Glaciecola sp. MF2-115 TaxID=3384827 RepID=UPI0039A204A8